MNHVQVEEHLRKEGCEDITGELARIVIDEVLTWKVEEYCSADDASAIIAFSYGFRFDENGNRIPGPVNEALAQCVLDTYTKKNVPVFAQWEIAQCLRGKIPDERLKNIVPEKNIPEGNVVYLSSEGVVKSAMALGMQTQLYPSVLVVAHSLHLVRCLRIVVSFGFFARSMQGSMPKECDIGSGQLWTADRLTGIISDMISRLAAYRKNVLYPKLQERKKTVTGS